MAHFYIFHIDLTINVYDIGQHKITINLPNLVFFYRRHFWNWYNGKKREYKNDSIVWKKNSGTLMSRYKLLTTVNNWKLVFNEIGEKKDAMRSDVIILANKMTTSERLNCNKDDKNDKLGEV